MREIKVKVWDTKEKKWLVNPQVELVHKEISWGNEFYLEVKESIEDYDPTRYVFIQSTDIKDKNGKEIYEGDIVEWEDLYSSLPNRKHNCVVTWDKETVCFQFQFIQANYQPVYIKNPVRIIGNIYENKELLKVGENKK